MLQPRFAGKVHHPARPARRFFFDREAETLPRAALEKLQLRRLRATVKEAYAKVPLHRSRMQDAGIEPRDLRSLEDLGRLPFTLKSDLRDHYPFGLFARPRASLARLHASSGTTGKPTVVGYTRQDIATWASLMARSFACAGVRPGDVVHNAYGYGLFTGGLGAHYGAERLGATVVPMSGGATERQVLLIRDFGARVLCATPPTLAIAEVGEEGVDAQPSSRSAFSAPSLGRRCGASRGASAEAVDISGHRKSSGRCCLKSRGRAACMAGRITSSSR
jgi:phenylacetate-CoA ligase